MNGQTTRDNRANTATGEASVRIDLAHTEIDITKDHLGVVLSQRRHLLGMRIEEIAEDIKVRPEYLRALEQEAMDKLPTPEYARLFLKAYAERLGLNVSEVYALLDLSDRPQKPVAVSGEPVVSMARGTRRPPVAGSRKWWYIAGVGIILLVAAGLLFGPKQKSPPVRDEPISEPEPVAQDVTTQTQSELVAETPAFGPPYVLALTFDRDTWLSLTADDVEVASRLMRAGERIEASAAGQFRLSLGHTQGVRASVNGRGLRPFESWTERVSGLTIVHDSMVAWMQADASGIVSGGADTVAR